jgi:Uma2 family endonuclease
MENKFTVQKQCEFLNNSPQIFHGSAGLPTRNMQIDDKSCQISPSCFGSFGSAAETVRRFARRVKDKMHKRQNLQSPCAAGQPLLKVTEDSPLGNKAMAKQEVPSTGLTYEDYLLFPDDGKRHEIIEGDHYMTPAPRTKHQRVSGRLFVALSGFTASRRLGEVFAAPFDVVFSDENVVQPDLLFVSTPRAGIVTDDNIQGAPDLVVEIISETTRKKDEVTKRKLYERFGVAEYWIVDPELETVKIFTRTQQKFSRALELSKEENYVLTTEILPGFRLALTDIFE